MCYNYATISDIVINVLDTPNDSLEYPTLYG